MEYKIGDTVKVSSENDNENYNDFRDKTLIITHAENKGVGYDEGMFPQGLYCFETLEGEEIDSSLYDYELILIERGDE